MNGTCLRLVALALPLAVSAMAFAADAVFDDRPLKIIVGMPVGGGVDAYARLVQKHLQRFLPGSRRSLCRTSPVPVRFAPWWH